MTSPPLNLSGTTWRPKGASRVFRVDLTFERHGCRYARVFNLAGNNPYRISHILVDRLLSSGRYEQIGS